MYLGNNQYINLVFESGGIKGLAYVGAIKYFEERGYKFFQCVGSSVGAIFASLCVGGLSTSEMINAIDNLEVNELLKKSTLKEGFSNKGLYDIKILEEKIDKILSKNNVKYYKDVKYGDDYLLKIVVTDNKKKDIAIIPDDLWRYGYNPDNFKISTSVAMSCSIPYFYTHYCLDKNKFIDGGAINKFPLDVITDKRFRTYGLKINQDNIFWDKLQKIVYRKMRNNSVKISDNNHYEIINIDTLNVKSIQFNKGLEMRRKLYLSGYKSVYNYFSKKYK